MTLTIEDDGDGIPLDERQQVTKPFWRGSNNAAVKGHGMGLAIVARIAVWLDARLEIAESKQLGGAAISLCFKALG